MAKQAITLAGLNRATLARQMLLRREKVTPLRAVERLVGLQAQEARPPFIGLWSRVAGFRREALASLLLRREAVRATAMRCTLHLMSARDYAWLRPTLQPALTDGFYSALRRHAEGLDIARVVGWARRHLAGGAMTFEELRARLARHDPRANERVMGYAVRTHLPLVQVPTDAPWGFPAAAKFAIAEAWLKSPLDSAGREETLVLRYLAAFGPATAADAQAWSSLRGLAEVFQRLRGKLRVLRDERGRELFDLPRGPRPPATMAVPVRFLPEYDNLVLSHADRTRVIDDAQRRRVVTANLRVLATFLVDGRAAGTWKIERGRRVASLRIEPFEGLPSGAREALAEEAAGVLRFAESDAPAFEVLLPGRASGARAGGRTAVKPFPRKARTSGRLVSR
jgi:hypothetical protein